jgi:two-component sensor histidine kinase
MKRLKPTKIFGKLLAISCLVFFLFLAINAYFSFNSSNKIFKSPNELSEKFGLTLFNDIVKPSEFSSEKKLKTNKNIPKGKIIFYYKPVLSVAQTYRASISAKVRGYRLLLTEMDTVPKLLEVRLNRVKVPILPLYSVANSASLMSLKFEPIKNSDNEPLKYQWSIPTDGGYEDFGNENTLNVLLPIGKSQIFVRAVDFKNKRATKYYKIETSIKIPLLKRAWFWPVIFFLILFPLFYFYTNYVVNKRQFKLKQQLALEQQRNKMTADLHDDIGATLSSLQINSAVASQLFQKDPKEAQIILNKIEQQSQKLADKISDVIWSQNRGKEELIPISLRIKDFVNDILGASNINYKLQIEPKIDTLISDITTRKNVVMLVKEAINNAAKYSEASELSLIMKLESNKLLIEITDNGIGFEPTKATGNGLINMRKRVEDLAGDFIINSTISKGTTILASFPLSLELGRKAN